MGKERMPHDSAYKQFFSNPEMVESLLRDFVSADFIADLDFSTLERCSGSYVTDDLRERHDDIVWRVGWKKGGLVLCGVASGVLEHARPLDGLENAVLYDPASA